MQNFFEEYIYKVVSASLYYAPKVLTDFHIFKCEIIWDEITFLRFLVLGTMFGTSGRKRDKLGGGENANLNL